MTAVIRGIGLVRRGAGSIALLMACATFGKAQQVPESEQVQVGDRIALTVQGGQGAMSFSDTVTVREGLSFTIPSMGDISVQGVRRSDIQPYLTKQIAKYVKEPVVKAVVLVRIGVFGAVNKPGYYSIRTDVLFSDIMMVAGGPVQTTDPNKIVIKRGGKIVLSEKEAQVAVASGQTATDVHLMTNDVVELGEKPKRNFMGYVQVVSALVGVVALAVSLTR